MTQPIHQTNASGRRRNARLSAVRKTAFLLMTLVMTAESAQQKPTTGYAPVNGIKMYYEVHGRGELCQFLRHPIRTRVRVHGGNLSDPHRNTRIYAKMWRTILG